MKLYFPPLFLLFLCSVSSSTSNGKIRDAQKLLSFKSTLPNPEILSTWKKNTDPCEFIGVSCDDVVSRVTSLNLSFLPISSNLSAIVTHLFQIELLGSITVKSANISGNIEQFSPCSDSIAGIDLAGNSISGGFYEINHFGPCSNLITLNLSSNLMGFSNEEELNKIELKKLEVLDISHNNFSTALPKFGENNVPNLKHLDLSSNKFYGEIGDSFLGFKKLTLLNVSHNFLSGVFPESLLGPDSKLEFLYLASNKLQGEIPQSFAVDSCSTLVEFDISYNNFSGMIPSGFGSCNLVQILDVSYNNFSGVFPSDLFLKMGNLRRLLLSFNNFVGTLPDSFYDLAKLESLDLSSNRIMGEIPSGICENPSLRELHLQNNLLDGAIPETLGNCSELVSLDLSFNYLTGKIPRSLGSLSNLKDLIMLMNKLEGEIPSELMYVRPLENLILDYNQLTGSIPFGLSNCTNLIWISLSSNMLSGEIPSWIGSLDNLAILKLGNNSFFGQIPAELGDCKSLLWLDLNSNLLNGEIPSTLAKQSGNMAVGLVVGKKYVYWRNQWSKECRGTGNLLEFAGVRDNALDRIPTRHTCNFTQIYRGITHPIFNHNGSMIFLDLSYNNLEGSIPKELGAMYYLSILNLGHNKISGPIPQDLGRLKNVGVLDLSHNNLSGQIPGSLAGLTLLTDIDFSFNDLSGTIPPSGQFETFPAYRFFNNSGLCGYPLPICNGDAGANAYPRQKRRRQASFLRSVGVGLLFSLFCIFALIIVGIEMKKRRKNQHESSMDVYRGSNGNSHSGGRNSAWKFTNHREALSINLATFEKPLQKLTFADLLEATNGFHDDSIIGKGGFGDVYKARLKDGNVVAIKKLIQISGQGDREFTAEMETIGKIKHRNLVPLLGYCKVGEERLLVYEYMKYGSLDDVLHNPKKGGIKLNWAARRKIALGAARGLAFLHHNCVPHIIHRDMKSSNVLVDENQEARVSDFGMARLMSAMDTHLSVSTLAGTPGYVPPEYYQSFRCSTKGDVYSFGVVLLELLTGKQPTDSADFGDNNLVGWVKQHAKLKITDVFDPELLKEDRSLEVELLQHLQVASACLDDRPWKRPSMIEVMAMFKEIQAGGSGLHSSSTITEESEVRYGGMGGSFSTVEMLDMSIKQGNLKE